MTFDWNNIDTVLLDMDGTLLDLHFDSHFWLEHMPRNWASKHQMEFGLAREKLSNMLNHHVGTLNWYCVDFWSDALDLDIMALKQEVAHKISYRPTAQSFLERCQQESQDVRLITNAHRKVLDLKIGKTGIDQYFHHMLCSHELDYPKENPHFWHRLQELNGFDPTRTLFIDDTESVLESAEQFGIKHLYSIAKPDSQAQRKAPSRFPMLDRLA